MRKLKHASLTRAENLSEETRKEYNLPDKGLVVVETWQQDESLQTEMVATESISEYLRVNLGPFKDVEIDMSLGGNCFTPEMKKEYAEWQKANPNKNFFDFLKGKIDPAQQIINSLPRYRFYEGEGGNPSVVERDDEYGDLVGLDYACEAIKKAYEVGKNE